MVQSIQAKSILNRTRKRDPWFLDDYTVNPYSGCSFNCLFCYIRGSKYGIHMERKLQVKENAAQLLDKQLGNRAKKGQYGIIVLSSATEPYLHVESDRSITRELLEIILRHRFPVHMITRSHGILEDLDLLDQINHSAILPGDLSALRSKAIVTLSFSTIDDGIARIFEPGATPPSGRLNTLQEVARSGLLTGVSMMPILPFISDSEEVMTNMINQFKVNGAHYVMPASLTLFGMESSDSKQLVLRAISKYFPELHARYQTLYKDSSKPPSGYQNQVEAMARALVQKAGLRTTLIERGG